VTARPSLDGTAPIRLDRRAARRQETKDQIVAAAWELVRERGLAGLALRELGERVGMKAQSLYSYFAAKNEIYDAMFREGYLAFAATWDDLLDGRDDGVGASGAELARLSAQRFFDFCTSDPVRYQLLFQRHIPDFVPSDESYAVALATYEAMTAHMAEIGITGQGTIDLWTALLTGLTDQQISNDPGGDRWERLVDRAVDMFLTVNAPHLLDRTPEGNRP
jgi:AcrR family transcriptional regulator